MLTDDIRGAYEIRSRELREGPITPEVDPAEIREFLADRYDFSRGLPLDDVVRDVEKMLRMWQVQVTHPRYFGLFNPSVTMASVVADTLTALYNPQLATWSTSPAANEIERHTLNWLASRFGLPADSLASFTTGGAEANLSAIIVALTRAFPACGDEGLRALPAAPTFYVSAEAHHSFSKIAHLTGLGRQAVRAICVRDDLRMDLDDLARQIEQDRGNGFAPFMVVGTAGTTSTGAIDPLGEIAAFCRDAGLWFHADAAWGGAIVVSSRLRHHLAGIECADSITCDAHKWFSVPMGCGMFFCRHPESAERSFRADASYMPGRPSGDARDPYTSTIQWSRRFIGLKLFLSLAEQGEAGQAGMIERQTHLGDVLREALRASGWRIANDTPLPLVCFTRDGLDTAKFLRSVLSRQTAWMSETRVRGEKVVRACITSFRTTENDIAEVVEQMNALAPEAVTSCIAAEA
jgi:glutamate/tyrosine decarboxylase-like PLP-dependent enzyme